MNLTFTIVGEKRSFVKAFLYGRTGAGKTRFTADAPNPYWYDSEDSTETLKHLGGEYAKIPFYVPTGPSDFLKHIRQNIKDERAETYVLDTFTTILNKFVRKLLGANDASKDQRQEYREATQVFARIMGELQEAAVNVVIIGHRRVSRHPETGQITGIWPDVTPALQESVQQLVNVVGYLDIEPSIMKGKTVRKLYMNPTPLIEAKNRLNIQEPFIENPTWKEVFGNVR